MTEIRRHVLVALAEIGDCRLQKVSESEQAKHTSINGRVLMAEYLQSLESGKPLLGRQAGPNRA